MIQDSLFTEEEAEALEIENMERKITGQPQVTTITGLDGGPIVVIEPKEKIPETVKITFPGGGEVSITPSGNGINVQFSHISADSITSKTLSTDKVFTDSLNVRGLGSVGSLIVTCNLNANSITTYSLDCADQLQANSIKVGNSGRSYCYGYSEAGTIKFDTGDSHFKGWNGTHWVTFG